MSRSAVTLRTSADDAALADATARGLDANTGAVRANAAADTVEAAATDVLRDIQILADTEGTEDEADRTLSDGTVVEQGVKQLAAEAAEAADTVLAAVETVAALPPNPADYAVVRLRGVGRLYYDPVSFSWRREADDTLYRDLSALRSSVVALFFDEASGAFLDESGNGRDVSSATISRSAQGVAFDGASYVDLPPGLGIKTLVLAHQVPVSSGGQLFWGDDGATQFRAAMVAGGGVDFLSHAELRSDAALLRLTNQTVKGDVFRVTTHVYASVVTSNLRLGARSYSPPANTFVASGTLAAVLAYDRVLTQAEIESAHNAIVQRTAGRGLGLTEVALPRLVTTEATPAETYLRTIPSPYDDKPGDAFALTHPEVLDMAYERAQMGLAGTSWNGYRYWMAITPYVPPNGLLTENPCLFASNDAHLGAAATWVAPPGVTNPVVPFPSSGFYADPDIALDPDGVTMHMVWKWEPGGGTIVFLHTSSTDGWQTRTADAEVLRFENSEGDLDHVAPCLHYDEAADLWYIWLVEQTSEGGGLNTFYRYEAASPGSPWGGRTACVTPRFEEIRRQPWHPNVMRDDRLSLDGTSRAYLMLVSYGSGGAGGSQHGRALTSTDGLTWYDPGVRLVSPSSVVGEWDAREVYRLSALATESGWDIWYSATGDDPEFGSAHRLGFTTLALPA